MVNVARATADGQTSDVIAPRSLAHFSIHPTMTTADETGALSSLLADNETAVQMTAILGTMLAILAGLVFIQTSNGAFKIKSTYIADAKAQPSKYAYEMYALYYTPVWIGCFAVIVGFQLYESFTATTYNVVCIGLSLPFLLQPLLIPDALFHSPDAKRPFLRRYSTKANLWLAVYSFIGNYWYTHYFYSVLKAEYTMPAHRLNNVPIALYFATHFYFSTYHVFSNACLRKVATSFAPGPRRTTLFVGVVIVLSYFTAFMETLTISSFPYYAFEDRNMAYTVGSAFYGIYFLVSFPAFYAFDEDIDAKKKQVTLWDTFVSSCGHGMMILCLLDFVRLHLGVPLVVGDPSAGKSDSMASWLMDYSSNWFGGSSSS